MGDGTNPVMGGAEQGAGAGASFGPWGALAGGVIGAGLGYGFGQDAINARKRAALESARRLAVGNEYRLGEATAAAGASGVEMGTGSMATYLSTMAAEFRRQNEWAVKQAQAGADVSQQTNALQGLSGVGSSLFQFGQNNNWWQSKP